MRHHPLTCVAGCGGKVPMTSSGARREEEGPLSIDVAVCRFRTTDCRFDENSQCIT